MNKKIFLTALELAITEMYTHEDENFIINVSLDEYKKYQFERLIDKAMKIVNQDKEL